MTPRFNIYSQKQQWKLILFVLALVIVGVSLAYTKSLVDKISEEERSKVQIWADAVQRRSTLVHYTSQLFEKLEAGERNKVELYVEATKYLARPDITEVSFALSVLNENTTVPVILTDENGTITSHRNVPIPDGANEDQILARELKIMASQYDPIKIIYYGNSMVFLYYKDSRLFSELKQTFEDLQQSFISDLILNAASSPLILLDSTFRTVIEAVNIDTNILKSKRLLETRLTAMAAQHDPIDIEIDGKAAMVYFEDSFLLTQLKYYPLAQLGVIGLFVIIAYLLFSTARKAEQNQVWVGMSKETAHQLGTPLSSMIGWIELLKEDPKTEHIAKELSKDIDRLNVVTDRFSKIGSKPKLEKSELINIIEEAINYFDSRTGESVKFEKILPSSIQLVLSRSLFEWVIENLIKNALDAMEGKGTITICVEEQSDRVYIDISDTGKGIPQSQFKSVFQPGYTSKKRGWGLGLSLSKRIIKEYHNGKIYVLKSEMAKGTTFRISLKKNNLKVS